MQHLDLKRKQPTAWPWLAGVAILALMVWGVTSLLAAPQAEPDVAVDAVEVEELTPAAIPAPPHPPGSSTVSVHELSELAPLDLEDAGVVARAEGEVVATGTRGFWLLAGSDIIRVDSDQLVRRGQAITVEGVLQESDGARTEQIAAEVLSRFGHSAEHRVVSVVKLVER
jgi:hypothetical protein